MNTLVFFVVDKGLEKLRAQVNAKAPNRSKASDGTIGDAAHAERNSDHNPESPPPPGNPDDQVDALDLTHDPAHGADMGEITEAIRLSKDQRVKYVIFNDRIFSSYPVGNRKAWEWGPYNPNDPNRDRHTNHGHFSVNDVHHDETQDWVIEMAVSDDDVLKIWNFDVDPSDKAYTAKGVLWTAYLRAGAAATAASSAQTSADSANKAVADLAVTVNKLAQQPPGAIDIAVLVAGLAGSPEFKTLLKEAAKEAAREGTEG